MRGGGTLGVSEESRQPGGRVAHTGEHDALVQASYALVVKSSATVIEQTINPGTTLGRDLR